MLTLFRRRAARGTEPPRPPTGSTVHGPAGRSGQGHGRDPTGHTVRVQCRAGIARFADERNLLTRLYCWVIGGDCGKRA
jgi:hypothetical protein